MVAIAPDHFRDPTTFLEPRRGVTLRAARRRTALVRGARSAVLAAMGCIVVIIAALVVRNALGQAPIAPPPVDESASRMVNPKFNGRDANGNPFEIVADAAVRRPADPTRFELEEPRLSVIEDGVVRFQIFASHGVYNRENLILDLRGDVQLLSGDEYEFETTQARLFIESGVAEGREPIIGRGPWGVINADAFELYRDERRVVFEGSPVIGRLDQEPKLVAPLRSQVRDIEPVPTQ